MANGVINIYKEKGYTSHDVVAIIRKSFRGFKVGHTGTLDPNAEGVLPICIGKATKLSQFIMDTEKTYIAEVILGISTDTEDITGNILDQKKVNVTEEDIQKVVRSFLGEYSQIPPMYSAIKINGKKMYELARKGQVVERKPRTVNILDIKIDKFKNNESFIMSVRCSKGTYIRTLCKDIGEKLGCNATMGDLIRSKTGMFSMEDSIKIDDFKNLVNIEMHEERLIKIDDVLANYDKVLVKEEGNKYLYNGNKISISYVVSEIELTEKMKVLTYDYEHKLISISCVVKEKENIFLNPLVMFI